MNENVMVADRQQSAAARVTRVVRTFTEASLVAIAFAVAILLIGIPVALLVRAVQAIVGALF